MCKNIYVLKFYGLDFINHINSINSTETMFKKRAYGKFFINPINLLSLLTLLALLTLLDFINFIDFLYLYQNKPKH